jgi:hypothetical protein
LQSVCLVEIDHFGFTSVGDGVDRDEVRVEPRLEEVLMSRDSRRAWPRQRDMCAVAGVAAVVLACGCSREATPTPEPAAKVEAHETGANVSHEGNRWRATTTIGGHSASPESKALTVSEEVVLDPDGHLVWAESRAHDGSGAPETHVTIDRERGLVTIERGPLQTSFTVPKDRPWVYGPVVTPSREAIATPLAAWVTHRAARGSEWVRLIEADERRSLVVPTDQVAVPTESGVTVVLGSDGADVDADFVKVVRLGAARGSLVREGTGQAYRFREVGPGGAALALPADRGVAHGT